VTDHTFGIEDPASAHYNTIVDSTQTAPDWKGADHMLRPDNLYQNGVMVQHNPHPGAGQQPPVGSCIFLHLWRGPGQPTVGCTAMSAEKISALTAWLRQDAQPRIVQLTQADYQRLRPAWGLPRIPEPPSLIFTLLGILAVLAIAGALLHLRRSRARP
jgi:D-alanyl-D-alanine dipeptidase